VNDQIKKREWYRPLSPSVLAEKSADWFDFPGPSPFMLFTAHCKRPSEVPAVVHVDGSARMQTVTKADNPRYYKLIREFEKLTGVPMVLNTSLNVDGQPMLETITDMREFWERGIVDVAVVGSEIWER
jgi:carbamoyltransferase